MGSAVQVWTREDVSLLHWMILAGGTPRRAVHGAFALAAGRLVPGQKIAHVHAAAIGAASNTDFVPARKGQQQKPRVLEGDIRRIVHFLVGL